VLNRLADQGLLEKTSSGRYAVRSFTVRDIEDAIEDRGVMEGMAARLAAERGVKERALAEIKDCLRKSDMLLEGSDLDAKVIESHFELYRQIHNRRGLSPTHMAAKRSG